MCVPLACMEMNEYIPPRLHEFAAREGLSLPFPLLLLLLNSCSTLKPVKELMSSDDDYFSLFDRGRGRMDLYLTSKSYFFFSSKEIVAG